MKLKPNQLIIFLTVGMLLMVLTNVALGAVSISSKELILIVGKWLGANGDFQNLEHKEAILSAIRIPRTLLALLVGAALGISGAVIQGIFRNPLADPGIIGISSGASLFAVMAIVLEVGVFAGIISFMGSAFISLVAFLGALLATIVVYKISQVYGRTMVSTMLLVGIAINALAMAGTGILTYSADDVQLRSITFWMLGSLGAASWPMLAAVSPFILLPIIVLPFFAKPMNVFALGEQNVSFLGYRTEHIKKIVVLLAALGVGAAVAVSGIIGFVGLIVPHLVRLITGADHRYLILSSALMGSILVMGSDVLSRTLLAPTEIPIGIITSLVGAPFFLYLIIQQRKKLVLS